MATDTAKCLCLPLVDSVALVEGDTGYLLKGSSPEFKTALFVLCPQCILRMKCIPISDKGGIVANSYGSSEIDDAFRY
jgi:hypothetical protein